MNSINDVLYSSVSFDMLLFLRKVFGMLWPFRNVKDIRYRRIFTAPLLPSPWKKSRCQVYSGAKMNNSHGSIARNRPSRAFGFSPSWFKRVWTKLCAHSSIYEHNRKQAEMPVRWDFILVDWLVCSKVHSRGLVWNFCRILLPIDNFSLQLS